MRLWGIAVAVAACGGSPRHTSAPEDPERARIEAMKPPSPYVVRSIKGYTTPGGCSQGPFRIAATAEGARFGEQLEVNICAPRSLEGDARFTHGTDQGTPYHFGARNNSERCVPTAAEMASHGTQSAGQGGAAASRGDAGPPASLASAPPVALTPMTGQLGEDCPDGMYLTGIVNFAMMGRGDDIPWAAGTPLVVDVWSTEPLDLDGAIFVVIQRSVRPDMTVEGWKAYDEARDRWVIAWNAYLAGEVKAGRESYYDDKARSAEAPPPPKVEVKPPRPSVHAEWIAGFWQRDREWVWSAGFWRVPETDIAAEQTAEAPVAPPPVKTEAPPPVAASATLVWTPGYWAWNGSAYIWIDGAWRIPPHEGARWVAPTWAPRRGRVVLVPGGWSIHIGR